MILGLGKLYKHLINTKCVEDIFMFCVLCRIPHYGARVRSLLFKKKWGGAVAEARARAGLVLRAARDVPRSRRLRALLEIVLALGNYMNRSVSHTHTHPRIFIACV